MPVHSGLSFFLARLRFADTFPLGGEPFTLFGKLSRLGSGIAACLFKLDDPGFKLDALPVLSDATPVGLLLFPLDEFGPDWFEELGYADSGHVTAGGDTEECEECELE